MCVIFFVFFFKQKTSYEMRISDWSSDVCSSDLGKLHVAQAPGREPLATGTLNVSGSYQRYGKPLTIRHARLTYTRSPLDNPALDIRAERTVDAQMVGVQVRSEARRVGKERVSTCRSRWSPYH